MTEESSIAPEGEVLATGTRVGRYEIASLVGMGSMGAVYSAIDPDLERTVALKLVRAGGGSESDERRERLLREARTMAQLAHANVVAVHDVGTLGDRVFVAMDLVEGETLRSWLTQPRPTKHVLSAFLAAGRGLAAAHAAGVVHRDFTPENVLVGRDGRVLVTDFGLARGPATEEDGAVAGTPAYMAPEHLRGKEVDPRADQFSFCVALHEALAGERPFRGDRPAELLAAIGAGAFEDARAAPAHVRRALRRGLAPTPEARFPSMDSLLDELSRDAAAKARRIAVAASSVFVLVVAIVALVTSSARRERRSCRAGVSEKLRAVWSTSQRESIHHAFLATKVPYAEDSWTRVESGLDADAARWSAMHLEACDATHVRAEQSTALLDLRITCLGEHLDEMRSLIDVLAHADADVVTNAPKAVLSFGPLGRCADALSLRAVAAPPPERAEAIAALQHDIARAKALSDSGHVRESLDLARSASTRSVEVGYGPLTAKAFLRLGEAQVEARDGETASVTLRRAASLADAAKDDRTRVQALTRRLFVEAYLLRHSDRLHELDGAAAAGIARLGGDVMDLEGHRLHSLGMALLAKGSLPEATTALGEAVKLRERVHGAKSREVAMSRNGLCFVASRREDYATALVECTRATEVWSEILGPGHPELAFGLNNLGSVYSETGRYDEAATHFDAALTITERAFGAGHPWVAISLNNLGDALSKGGKHERAIAALLRALDVRENLPASAEPPIEFVLTSLGQAYLRSGDPARALAVFARAQTHESSRTPPDDHAEIALGIASALWISGDAKERRRARDIASAATTALPKDAPVRRRIEAWLAEHP